MKNLLLIFVSIIATGCAQKQTNYDGFQAVSNDPNITALQGKWRINELIANAGTKEYVLSPQSPRMYENYGNNIAINPDQSFSSSYSAECGNDCFTTTSGKYKIIDGNYICFYLEGISRHGDCSGNESPNADLGLYYFKKFGSIYRLVKSVGKLEQDEKNALYWDLIEEAYAKEWRYINLLQLKSVAYNSTEAEVVASCLHENKIDDYKIVHSRTYDNDSKKLFLVETNGGYRCVFYKVWDKKVGLFDDSILAKLDKKVESLKNETQSLKGTVSKEPFNKFYNALNKNTIETFQKDNVTVKIINTVFFNNGVSSTTTFYLQNNTPVFVEELIDFHNYVKKTEYYITNWQDNFGTGAIVKIGDAGGGSVGSQIKQQFERITKNK